MSVTTVVILNAVLVVGLVALLTWVMRIPFRLDSKPLPEPRSIERAERDELAA
ncbi:MAG TPA: hypothetical protein VMT59_07180 [Gaiellaceae bacterium]|nr:hypothetical protein [Gaiellaceae bacterium]